MLEKTGRKLTELAITEDGNLRIVTNESIVIIPEENIHELFKFIGNSLYDTGGVFNQEG